MLEKSKKCLSALYLLDYNNKNQTGYKASAFTPNDKDTITTGLYENKMKKSELRSIIKETYSEFQRAAKGSKGVMAKKKGEDEVYGAGVNKGEALEKQKLAGLQEDSIDEIFVGGEMIDPNVMSAIMATVPAIVGVGAAINWKEEITTWLKSLASKDDKIKDKVVGVNKGKAIDEIFVGGEMIDPNVMSAIMGIVPTLVAIGAAINWKEELLAWAKQMKAKYAK
jgi:precorrin-6B methylase 2